LNRHLRLVSGRGAVLLLALLASGAPPAAAADITGARDHPAINVRYPGSDIVGYTETEFDEYRLLVGPVERRGVPGKTLDLEGKVTNISYEISAERSTLEVMRNYEIALRDLGFVALFECKNEICGGRAFNHTVVPYIAGFAESHADQRFYSGKLERPEGPVYLSLYVVRNTSAGGPTRNRIYARVDVIETRPMQTGMEVKKADELRSELAEKGRAVIHSILFAFDSAEILAESRPALDEVAKLLREDSGLAVRVVGHTDNQGTLDYNLRLSERRAQAVVDALVASYGIQRSRMSGHGVGFLAPVAPNTSQEGQKLNRRVELVRR
jgi:outer membrane protein OmpA-like peptidoglycan-associated protein